MMGPDNKTPENTGIETQNLNISELSNESLVTNEAQRVDNAVQENVPVQSPPVQTIPSDDGLITTTDNEEIVEEFSESVEKVGVPYLKRAEQIIDEYKTKPYEEAEEVEKLEAEYLKERFGVILGDDKK